MLIHHQGLYETARNGGIFSNARRFERLRIAAAIERQAKREFKQHKLVSAEALAKCSNLIITRNFGEAEAK